ncbi:MAG: UDP-N-acetylmuramoyl-tripeptide--D-alanyl-D-alanine ligase [Nannocystaceae bacterium]|nr:UDP-N-acetylmuramoyl-tripeptide--D-alanyl-D-alanine ligase [Nannocystaceae bacterium]
MRWSPESLAEHAGGVLVQRGSRDAAGAFIDSRAPLVGGLFVPIVAARDGHDFIDGAVEGGAAAVLVGRGKSLPKGDVTVVEVDDTLEALTRLASASRDRVLGPVVSITGSNGKTTTRSMIEAVLRTALPNVLCTQGNLNNHLGVPLTLLGEPHEPGAMVVELGMNAPGENDHLARIVRPTVAVITSVALEHLEFMGSIEAIAAAEREPVAHVQSGGVVVAPADEPLLTAHLPKSGVLSFGPGSDATVVIEAVRQRARTETTLRLPDGQRVTLQLQMFGLHNARNAAAALCVGLHLKLPVAPMLEALEKVTPVGDRGRALTMGEHLVIADCYNANPGSVQAALRSLAALRDDRSGPLVAVLGDMLELGPTEASLHADSGRLCAELGLDCLVTLGPRCTATAEAARSGGIEAVDAGDDVDAAAQAVRSALGSRPGAVLIKASRGMRLERVVSALVDS